MYKHIKIILVAVIGLLVLAAASAILVSNTRKAGDMVDWQLSEYPEIVDEFETEPSIAAENITQSKWIWKETVFNNDTKETPKNPENFILIFKDEDSFFATTDCNNIMGGYEIKDSTISFGEIGSTLMACMGESQQNEFTESLGEVQSFFVSEQGQLIMELPYDSGSMIFEPVK